MSVECCGPVNYDTSTPEIPVTRKNDDSFFQTSPPLVITIKHFIETEVYGIGAKLIVQK